MWIQCATAIAGLSLTILALRYSRYRRVRLPTVVAALLAGVGCCIAAGHLEDALITSVDAGSDVVAMAFIAAIVEETLRAGAVFVVCMLLFHTEGDRMHAAVAGCLVGIGFALNESWVYTSATETDVAIAGRELVRLVLHMLLGGIAGYAIGCVHLDRAPTGLWPLVAAVDLHFAWDALCGIPAVAEEPTGLQRGLAVSLMLTSMALFGFCLLRAEAATRRELALSASSSLLRPAKTLCRRISSAWAK